MVIRYNYIVPSAHHRDSRECSSTKIYSTAVQENDLCGVMPTSNENGLFDLDLLWLSLSLSASAVRINRRSS